MHEGMLDGGAVIGILPQQGRIGSMQSGDDARCESSQHLRGQTRGQCMWHCIMNMKKIELLGTRHFRHFHCEGQSVVGARKQSIVHDFDSMEMKALLRQVQSNGLSITEEVNFMTAARQFRPEGRRQNPTPANQRKTCNPNFEWPRFHYNSVYALSKSEISSRLMNFTRGASALLM